jgi:hypothetical protein
MPLASQRWRYRLKDDSTRRVYRLYDFTESTGVRCSSSRRMTPMCGRPACGAAGLHDAGLRPLRGLAVRSVPAEARQRRGSFLHAQSIQCELHNLRGSAAV